MGEQKFVHTNGIQLAYIDHGGEGEPLILMHGLSANCHHFDGLIAAGLTQHARVLAVDLRGRGLSDKPAGAVYSPEDHARDIVGMMDALGLERANIGGHSYGGLMTIYLGANYPERVKKMVILDAGVMHPAVKDLIAPALKRLGQPVASFEAYLASMKQIPAYHQGMWNEHIVAYYRADVADLPDGRVLPRSSAEVIGAAVDQILEVDWNATMPKATEPAILIHGTEGVGPAPTPPVLTDDGAQQTLAMLPNCQYVRVAGNHYTMLYESAGAQVVSAIGAFLAG
ncbi:MAG: alpha/beta hydrolase [Chloroflexota bacterium]|nr:alpha/beta hydrolase [Chloroflexota bacterium]